MPKVTRTSAHSITAKSCHVVALSTRRRTRSGLQPTLRRPSTPNAGKLAPRRTPKLPAFAFLARNQELINADPNRTTRLFALPRELLQQIASHLPLISTICLTLTCKEAAETVGTQSWDKYKREKRWSIDREGFIELLSRDCGDVLDFCQRCDTLHPPLQPPRSHRETKLTKWCFGQDAMIDYLPQDALHGYNPVFQHIANAIEESKDFAKKGAVGPLIDSLYGSFTIVRGDIIWSLESSAQRIDGSLLLKHVHTFWSPKRRRLNPADLLALPIRLCPHQSTTTAAPARSNYLRGKCRELNNSLLTHVINAELVGPDRVPSKISSFRPLTPSEKAQVSAMQEGDAPYWRCRSCPTKYRVQHQEQMLSITTWHCFGRDLYHAGKYWKWLVRRAGTTLGPDKRNDEWWSQSRTVPNFICQL